MRRIQSYDGDFVVQCLFKLTPYVFLRPCEIRQLEWAWIDFERKRISIPAEIMKMRQPHIVPLSPQSLAIINDIKKVTFADRFVFTGRGNADCVSDGTINKCLRKIGYDTQKDQDFHGFRGLASTQLYEQGITPPHKKGSA